MSGKTLRNHLRKYHESYYIDLYNRKNTAQTTMRIDDNDGRDDEQDDDDDDDDDDDAVANVDPLQFVSCHLSGGEDNNQDDAADGRDGGDTTCSKVPPLTIKLSDIQQ